MRSWNRRPPVVAALSDAISILSEVISRLAAVSFTVVWVTSLLRLLLVDVRLATVERSDAVAVARLAIASAVSCCKSM